MVNTEITMNLENSKIVPQKHELLTKKEQDYKIRAYKQISKSNATISSELQTICKIQDNYIEIMEFERNEIKIFLEEKAHIIEVQGEKITVLENDNVELKKEIVELKKEMVELKKFNQDIYNELENQQSLIGKLEEFIKDLKMRI